MTDQEDRERESQETEDTRYDRERGDEVAAREAVAERVQSDPPPEADES